jgi:GGDEF domain-containing protein
MKDHVMSKVKNANNVLMHPSDGLPPVSLSVGAAFSDRDNPGGTIFQDADSALYKVKNGGRCGCHVY